MDDTLPSEVKWKLITLLNSKIYSFIYRFQPRDVVLVSVPFNKNPLNLTPSRIFVLSVHSRFFNFTLKEIVAIWKRKFHSENVSNVSVHTTPEEFKNATISGHFGFVFEENTVSEIALLSWRPRFRKTPISKCFPSTRKRKASVFKFFRFEERFRRPPQGGLTVEIKLLFEIFPAYGLVWTLPPRSILC